MQQKRRMDETRRSKTAEEMVETYSMSDIESIEYLHGRTAENNDGRGLAYEVYSPSMIWGKRLYILLSPCYRGA